VVNKRRRGAESAYACIKRLVFALLMPGSTFLVSSLSKDPILAPSTSTTNFRYIYIHLHTCDKYLGLIIDKVIIVKD